MITLTNPEQYTAGASVLESNAQAAATNPQFDFNNLVITWSIQTGTVTGNVFVPGQRSEPIVVIVNIPNGTWMAGSQNGNLTPAVQAALRTQMINMRNSMENFATVNGLVAGTITPWAAPVSG